MTQSALTALQTIARTIQALSTQAAAPTATPQTNASLQNQITQLVSEFNSIGANTQFNGVHLFSGGATTTTPQIVQSANAGFDSGAAVGNPTSVTATFTNPLTPGNLVVAVFSHGDGYNGGGGAGVITPPPGFTLVQNTDNGSNTGIAVYTHVVTAGDSGSYMFTLSNSVPGNTETAALLEISGADQTTPVAAVAGVYQDVVSADNPLMTAAINAPEAHDLAIAGFTPNVDYGTETISTNLTVVGGYSQLYNDSTVATASSTAAGQTIEGSYSNSANPTNGASILLLLHPQPAGSTSLITAPITPRNADVVVGTIPVINANFSGLSAINVVASASNAETLSTSVVNTLSALQTAVGANERTIAESLENIDTTLAGVTATYASSLQATSGPASAEATNEQEATLQSTFGRALIAQANIPNANVLSLFLAHAETDVPPSTGAAQS